MSTGPKDRTKKVKKEGGFVGYDRMYESESPSKKYQSFHNYKTGETTSIKTDKIKQKRGVTPYREVKKLKSTDVAPNQRKVKSETVGKPELTSEFSMSTQRKSPDKKGGAGYSGTEDYKL
tara:strand:+ start:208 stop:567 length:360 start_codon:yes stop_codon:yes gene_type:complete